VHTLDIGFAFVEKPLKELLGFQQVIFTTTNEVAFVATDVGVEFFSLTGSSISPS
jgi:hypothetical protein